MTRPRRKPLDTFTAIVFLLLKAPRTAPELADLVGCEEDAALGHLRAMEAEGLVKERRRGTAGRPAAEFAWAMRPEYVA